MSKFLFLSKYFSIHILKSLIAGALVGFSLAVVLYGITSFLPSTAAIKDAFAKATTVRPESYSELYFANHTSLLKSPPATDSASFSFVIHNNEHKEMEYPYVVFLETNSIQTVLDQGVIVLKHDQSKEQKVFVPTDSIIGKAKIVVRIQSLEQQIHYWIGEKP
jgi:hypothetical protein